MTPVNTIANEFKIALDRFNKSPAIQHLLSGRYKKKHYASILREFFHYTKENPQLQALATAYFRGSDRSQVKPFLRHAMSEIGHDQLAIRDLRALGIDTEDIALTRPLPATKAFTAFAVYQICFDNAIGYLGVVYFLEHMPTHAGPGYAAALQASGIPIEAMTFLREHVAVDVAHNRLMEQYLEAMIQSEGDLDAIVYAIHCTADLYASLLWAAIQRGDTEIDYGKNWEEAKRMNRGKTYKVSMAND